jgi:hypothetical protein
MSMKGNGELVEMQRKRNSVQNFDSMSGNMLSSIMVP